MYGPYSCTFFTADHPGGIAATVLLKSGAISVVPSEGGPVEVRLHEVRVSAGGYDGRMVVLAGSAGGRELTLYFADRSVIQGLALLRPPPGLAMQLAALSRGRRKGLWALALGLAVGVAGLGALIYWVVAVGFGAAVGLAVEQVPVELEAELSKAVATEQLGAHQVCSAGPVNQALGEIGDRLVKALPSSPYRYRFRVIDAPDLNAFALPAGYIFVHWGLVEAASSADQVAGVLAHEIQHSERRHGLRNVAAQIGIWGAVGLLFGDLSVLAGAAGKLAGFGFSREQEEEADQLGLELLVRARFDAQGMPSFFRRVQEEEETKGIQLPAFLSTHPDTQARIDGLLATIAAMEQGPVEPLSLSWAEVVEGGCLPVRMTDPDQEEAVVGGTGGE